MGLTSSRNKKPPVTVSGRRPRAFNVPVGSRLCKIRGLKPFTYLEEGGVPHMQTFKGDKADKFEIKRPSSDKKEAGDAPKETVSSCVAVPNLGPPEQCEICDSELGWVQRARPEDHEFGRLGRCRQYDWHLCAVSCDQNARCTCLEHFENPKTFSLSRDFGEGFQAQLKRTPPRSWPYIFPSMLCRSMSKNKPTSGEPHFRRSLRFSAGDCCGCTVPDDNPSL